MGKSLEGICKKTNFAFYFSLLYMGNRFTKMFLAVVAMSVLTLGVSAQEEPVDSVIQQSIESVADSSKRSVVVLSEEMPADKARDSVRVRWVPDSKKAMWMAIAIPGGGQIYNRKYWKLPIIYGGFIGCVYALRWNDTMYSDYSQAYIDIMDDDPNTKSYEDFIPIGYDVKANETRLKELFKRKKNYYRRYRDLSMFCMIGVYALSILDAYVDAELSSFDIDEDLSLKVRPSVITSHDNLASRPSMMPNAYGVRCSLSF